MSIWKIKSLLYRVRTIVPLSVILNREMRKLSELAVHLVYENNTLLDVGTGCGQSLDVFPDHVRIITLDSCPDMVSRIHRPLILPLVADACAPPFPTDTFSAISAVGISEYLPDIDLFFSQMASLLNPGGFLLFTTSPPGLFSFLRAFLGTPLKTYSPQRVLDKALRSGLSCVKQTHTLMQNQYLFKKISCRVIASEP